MPTYYQFIVAGHLHDRWADWFDGLAITNVDEGRATLTGVIVDQAALHGVIMKLRDLGLPLIAVYPIDGGIAGLISA